MKKLSIAYFGSSDFSARFLEKLITDTSMYRYIEVKFVVTQPDRPVGRKQVITPTPVKTVAQKYGLEVLEIGNLKIENSLKIENFKLKIRELDLVVLYAYGGIVPQQFLSWPKHGFWCLHPSLLPKYRGTSPMATALINGDKKTGMTIIKMDDRIDHGPIIAQESLTIEKDDKRPDLEKKLTELGFNLLKKTLPKTVFTKDSLHLRLQNHAVATYSKKLTKQDGFIPYNLLVPRSPTKKDEVGKIENFPEKIYNLFRGLYPWPGIWTLLRPFGTSEGQALPRQGFGGQTLKRLKITDMDYKDGKLIIRKVQLEGKKEVDFKTFSQAYHLKEFLY